MGAYRLGERLAKPGVGVACAARAMESGDPALALVIPTPRDRDVVAERLFSEGWHRCRLPELEGVCALRHAELLPGPDGWSYAAVVDPYRPSHTIARFIDEHGPLTPLNALRFLKIIARALVALEQRQLHHGYLTPEQVVLDGRGKPMLTHPLLAQAERSLAGSERVPHGFLAPELLDGGQPSMATDCYAAGALLHFVATGKPPMAGLDIEEFHPELLAAIDADPSRSHRGLDPAVVAIIRRAMAVYPHERYAGAIHLLHEIERAQKAVVETRDGFDAVDEEDAIGGTGSWNRPVKPGTSRYPSGIRRRGQLRSGDSSIRPPREVRDRPRTTRLERRRAEEPATRRYRRDAGPSPLVWLMLVALAAGVVIGMMALKLLQAGS